MDRQLLLTPEIRERLPRLYAQEKLGEQTIVHVKFFGILSLGQWTWYVTEGEPIDADGELCRRSGQPEADFLFFGLVCGYETELGYFCLSELQCAIAMGGRLPLVERDEGLSPIPLSQARQRHRG